MPISSLTRWNSEVLMKPCGNDGNLYRRASRMLLPCPVWGIPIGRLLPDCAELPGISWHDFLTPDLTPLVEIGNRPLGIIVRITDTVAPVANTVVLAEDLLLVGMLEICA